MFVMNAMKRMMTMLAGMALAVSAYADWEPFDVSAAKFPRADGERDDAARLQRAVDATGPGGVLYLPRGEYEVSKTIFVTNGASLVLHKSATVRAVQKMDCIFHIDMKEGTMWKVSHAKPLPPGMVYDQGLLFKGGHLDGNGFASCLYLNHYFHFSLRDVVFVNGFPYGLHVGRRGAEIIANNLYFRTIKRGLAGNVALFSEGHDSQYSDLVAVDYTVGLRTTGGANSFTRFHVWGGPIPPAAPGRLPEMLENSVCFDLGGHMNTLRDSYADTGETGFNISGWGHNIVGCWFLNNTVFGMKKITLVRQHPDSRNVQITDGVFRGSGEGSVLYEGPGNISWRGMVYYGLPDEKEFPGEAVCEPDSPQVTRADDWELITRPENGMFASQPGEFAAPQSARALSVPVPARRISQRFPQAGAGKAVAMRVRATDDATKCFEFSLVQDGNKIWGKSPVPITREWREIVLPFSELKYFSHYKNMPKLKDGETPDARKIRAFRFVYGNWLTGGTADRAHGFEISSLKIIGR